MKLQFVIADVVVVLPVYGNFTYSILNQIINLVYIGSRVLVPFGNRTVIGYVIKLRRSEQHMAEFKNIVKVIDERPIFPEKMIILFKWLSIYYMHPLGQVIKAALPQGLNRKSILKIHLLFTGKIALKSEFIPELEKNSYFSSSWI